MAAHVRRRVSAMVADAAAPWILSEGRRTSHAASHERAACAATGFRARGVGDGDAVAILLGNGLPFLEACRAAVLAGAHPVPINTGATPEDIAFILGDCGAALVVTGPDLLPERRPPVPVVTVADAEDWCAWAGRQAPLLFPAPTARGTVIYTSGTTGRPKGVRRPPSPPGRPPVRALAVYGFDRPGRTVALIDGPLFHAVPNAYARTALGAGADIVLRRHFDPDATLAAIAEHRVTHLHLVPSAMGRLLALPEATKRRHDLSSLRHVVHGAAPCPPQVKRAMVAWWGPVIHEYYGSTETGLLTFQGSAEALAKPGSVGRPLPGIVIEVLDAEGRPLPTGAVGAVYAGSDTLHDFTYIGDPAGRAAIGRGDRVTAGDLGWVDDDGALFLVGRAAEVVRIGAAVVYPAAVEAALSGLPGVGDAAVIGMPAADGVSLVACVSPLPGALPAPEALRRALAERLAPEQVPGRIVVLERLPREETGKLIKHRLRSVLEQLVR